MIATALIALSAFAVALAGCVFLAPQAWDQTHDDLRTGIR